MKKIILINFLALTYISNYAQTNKNSVDRSNSTETKEVVSSYNKWSLEFSSGQSKGVKPYTPGYYSSKSNTFIGNFNFNNFNLGVRYMFSPKFGLKATLSSDKLANASDTDSKKFETQQYRFGVEGVVNACRLFDIQDQLGSFSLLIHGGVQMSSLTPKLDTGIDIPTGLFSNYNNTEHNIGVIYGVTPEYKITKKIAITIDFSVLSNFRQHYAWDGHTSDPNNNLAGQMISGGFGVSYSFGSKEIHGDWAKIISKEEAKIEALQKKIADIETLMNDTDKDGVPDYLDTENSSIAGVAVDTRGKMVDLNKNSVPDELEKYLANGYVDKSTFSKSTEVLDADFIKKLINGGYVTTYFETNKSTPTNVSTEGIDFILSYLRNNPTASVDVIGNSDEIGNANYNNKLAIARATSVKDTLVKAGIDASRLNVISKGEDKTVDVSSDNARRLVRRVTFRVK